MKTLLFITMILLNSAAFAHYEQKQMLQANGSTISRAIYSEDKNFWVDTFRIATDGWQDRIGHKNFATLKEAQAYFQAKTKNYPDKSFRTSSVTTMPTPVLASIKYPIWEVRQQWNPDWETEFSQWVKNNFDADFFIRHNIPTDCADVAYGVRWIFARIHGLPAAATLAVSGKFFTQDDGRKSWSALPTAPEWYNDQRFLKSLIYIFGNTFTHTLYDDSYPVEISPLGIQPGGHHLSLRQTSGHTRVINNTQPSGSASQVISFLASDVPAKVRSLKAEPFSLRRYIGQDDGGFLRFRWPQMADDGTYSLVPAEQMPHYSLDQYGSDFENFYYRAVTTRMGLKDKPEEYLKMLFELVWQKLQYRVPVVQDGFAVCVVQFCGEDTMNYEDWSTPSRDETTYELVDELFKTYNAHRKDHDVLNTYFIWKDLTLEIYPGKILRLEDLLNIWAAKTYSSDPRDSIEKRWGQ